MDDLPQMRGHAIGDRGARQRFLSRSIWYTVPGTAIVVAVLMHVVPPIEGMQAPADRIALALRWLLVALLPYAAVCLTILLRRFTEGAHDPLAGAESESLKIHVRVQVNTLEQFAWLSTCVLALAVLLRPEQMTLVPIACTCFAVARFVYWWGYLRSGTLGRGPGVQMTFTLNVGLLGMALVLFVRSLLA